MSTITQIQHAAHVPMDGIWGPRTRAAVARALGCADDVRAIQAAVGVAQDGKVGPLTLAAIAARLGITRARTDVFLDVGHTADRAREWPGSFASGLWATGDGKEIADTLGFTASTQDSVEHILNTAIARAVDAALAARGVGRLVFDKPRMANNAEITAVYTETNSVRPRAFVSIHCNAAGTAAWARLGGKASGTVAYYVEGRANGKRLATGIAAKLRELRRDTGGPDNRADIVAAGTYAVIRKLDSGIPACLVEVGFYDCREDLLWMVRHLRDIGQAIAAGIIDNL